MLCPGLIVLLAVRAAGTVRVSRCALAAPAVLRASEMTRPLPSNIRTSPASARRSAATAAAGRVNRWTGPPGAGVTGSDSA